MSMTGCKSSPDSTTDDAAATGEATDSVLDDAGRAIDEAADSATKEMENSFAAAKDKVDEATQTAAEKLGEATERPPQRWTTSRTPLQMNWKCSAKKSPAHPRAMTEILVARTLSR